MTASLCTPVTEPSSVPERRGNAATAKVQRRKESFFSFLCVLCVLCGLKVPHRLIDAKFRGILKTTENTEKTFFSLRVGVFAFSALHGVGTRKLGSVRDTDTVSVTHGKNLSRILRYAVAG